VAENPARSTGIVAVLTGYLILLEIVPSGWVVAPVGGVGTPANIYALLAFLWYGGSWLAGRVAPARHTRPARLAVFLFAGAILASYVSLAGVTRQPTGLELQAADRGLIGLVAWIGTVVIASAGIRDYAELQRVLRRMVNLGSVVGAVGMLEFFLNTDLLTSVHIPGLRQSAEVSDLLTRGAYIRPISLTADPLELAGVLSILLPFAIQQALDPERADSTWLRRWLPVMLIGGALPLTVSRTSIIGLAIILIMMLASWKPSRRWPALGVVAIGVAAVKVAVPGLVSTTINEFSTFFSNSDDSTQARTQDYSGVVQYVEQRPWFGRGFDTFIPSLYRYTDNMYLLSVVEIGFLGVLALLGLYLTGIRCGRVGRRLALDEPRRELGQCFAAAMAATLVLSATFDSLGFPMFAGLVFLLLGCAGAYLGIMRREALGEDAPPIRLPRRPGASSALRLATVGATMLTRPRVTVGPQAYPLYGEDGWASFGVILQNRMGGRRPGSDAPTEPIPIIRAPLAAPPQPPQETSAAGGDGLSGAGSGSAGSGIGDADSNGSVVTAPPESEPELSGSVHKGVRWSFINTVVMRIGNFLTGVFLARELLGPAEWGLYAIGLAALSILLAANEMGVSLAIVRWEGDVRRFAPTVLTLSTLSSTILYVLLYACAPEAARIFGSSDATSMLRVLGIAVIVDGISCVPAGVLTRNFAQNKRMVIDAANFLVSSGLTIALALDHVGAMSFAWGSVAGNVVGLIGCAICAPGMLRPGWNRTQARELIKFGLPLAGASLLVLMMLNVDSVVIGITLGPIALGLYQIAFNMASWPVRSVSEIARRVSFAGFSRIADSPRLADGFRDSLALLMAASVPACVLLMTLSKPLIFFVYGSQWTLASGALSFLAGLGLLRVAFELAYDCLVAVGRRRALILVQAWWLIALIPVLIFAARERGIAGVGAGHILVAGPLVTPLFLWALAQAGIGPMVVIRACARPFIGGVLMAAVALGIQQLHLSIVLGLFASAIPATVVYLAVVWPMRRMLRPAPATVAEPDPIALGADDESPLAESRIGSDAVEQGHAQGQGQGQGQNEMSLTNTRPS
jgi:O-antigen/teichoic acid export membrane protein